jgi:hypothetical protein
MKNDILMDEATYLLNYSKNKVKGTKVYNRFIIYITNL